jgi:uncharacterized protein YhaN
MNELHQEAQSSNINKTTVIDSGLGRSGFTSRQEGQEKVIARIDSQKLKELIRESLESSLKEPNPSNIPKRNLGQYKDSLEEVLAGFRALEASKAPKSPKIDNEQIMRMAQRAKEWRQRMFRDSDKPKKWKTTPQKKIDYIYYDDAPSTSTTHNTSINVENLNLEI